MKIGKQFRALGATLVRAEGDENADFLEFSFSSEEPVQRWFGEEILSHKNGAADFARLNDGANLLWNHDPDKVLGVVEKAWIGNDQRAYVRTRWAKNAFAVEKRADVEADIIRNVSFGYQVKEMELQNPGVDNEESKYLATKWMPYEVSFVSIPADQTVGMGRAEGEDKHEVRVLNQSPMGEVVVEKIEIDAGKIRAEANKEAADRVLAIHAMGEKFKQTELARSLIEGGKSVSEAQAAFLEKISTAQASIGANGEGTRELGLSEKEKGQFSFMRAIQAMANPTNRKLQEAARFEREVSEAGAKLRGKEAQGFFVPYEVLAHRDLAKGTPSAGGYLVGTEHRPQDFIEMLRKKSALARAGVRTLNGLVGDIAIPKQTGGATAYWVGEGSAPTESQQTFGQVGMSPKTVGAYTDLSRKLAIQSSPDVEMLVKADLATVLALAADYAGIYGSGSSNQPLGLVGVSGINTKDFAAADPTYLELVAMESLIAADDADVDGMKYLFNAAMRGALKGTLKFSSAGSDVVFADNGMVNGYGSVVSNQIVDGDVIFGNWNDMIMGYWSGIDLTVDTAALATSGGVRVIVLQDLDIAVRHAESFCIGNDAQ